MTAYSDPCDGCNADAGEPCHPSCTGLWAALNAIEDARNAGESEAGPGRSHDRATCPLCAAARIGATGAADRIVARGLTVEASKLYARLSHPSRGPFLPHGDAR